MDGTWSIDKAGRSNLVRKLLNEIPYTVLIPAALLLGLAMGFGCEYLFTQVFVVDLPTG